MKRPLAVLALSLPLALTATSCHEATCEPATGTDAAAPAPHGERVRLTGRCMGTSWSCVLELREGQDKERARGLVQGELDQVDALMSTWKATSELSALNGASAGEATPLSAPTLEVLRMAKRWHRESGGAFDPTVGALVSLWGFASHDRTAPPTPGDLEAARAARGFDGVHLGDGTATKDRAAIQLDLSAIAKGYGVDVAARRLRAEGFEDFLLEVGGEVVTRGRKGDGSPWYVGVEDPRLPDGVDPTSMAAAAGTRPPVARIPVRDAAVATSGDSRNVRRVNGRIVAHAIDPRSGEPVEHSAASVTVVAGDCATADALATAALVLGPEEGLALLERLEGVEGLILARGEDGELRWLETTGLEGLGLERRSEPVK